MLAHLPIDSEWAQQRLELIRQHHLEWAECFRLEEQAWQALGRTHLEQRAQLTARPFNTHAQAALIKEQTQNIKDWRAETSVNRVAIRVRQDREIAALNEKWQA